MDELQQSLSRARDALAKIGADREERRGAGQGPLVLGTLAAALLVAAYATGHIWLLVLALLLGAGAGVSAAWPRLLRPAPGIGMGATVGEGAVIEPGASVEMGATIGPGATVRSGAVVRMGATVGRGAFVEAGAVVSWGAEVQSEAVVGERASVGAGAVVQKGARVPAGMRVSPGVTYGASTQAMPLPQPLPAARSTDPRQLRTAAVCDRLEAELRASPEQVRAFLGGSDQTVASLRRTCEDLLRRESSLRDELDDASAAQLEEERAALQRRIGEEADAQLRSSLHSAVAAIDEVKRQRELLRVGADLLETEHTRLLYTLEALHSQFVRLRSAGKDTGATAELEKSVAQLRAELDAITDALEQVARNAPSAFREIAVAPSTEERAPVRVRERE